MLKALINSLENKPLNPWTLFSNLIGEEPNLKIDTKLEGTSTICPASPVYVTPSFPIHSPINPTSSFHITSPFGDVHTVRKLPPINSRTSATSISNS